MPRQTALQRLRASLKKCEDANRNLQASLTAARRDRDSIRKELETERDLVNSGNLEISRLHRAVEAHLLTIAKRDGFIERMKEEKFEKMAFERAIKVKN